MTEKIKIGDLLIQLCKKDGGIKPVRFGEKKTSRPILRVVGVYLDEIWVRPLRSGFGEIPEFHLPIERDGSIFLDGFRLEKV